MAKNTDYEDARKKTQKLQIGLKFDNILRIDISYEELLLLPTEDRQRLQEKLRNILNTVNKSLGYTSSN